MHLVQVKNNDGENIGLYDVSRRMDDYVLLIETAFESEDTDEYLEANDIQRVFVNEEITV